jgi:hypothetical protein
VSHVLIGRRIRGPRAVPNPAWHPGAPREQRWTTEMTEGECIDVVLDAGVMYLWVIAEDNRIRKLASEYAIVLPKIMEGPLR